MDPIKLTGNAISLQGKGRRDPLGNFDLWLNVLYGRDRFHLPVVSDLMREASSQILVVRMLGTMANPKFSLEPLPQFKQLGARRSKPGRNEHGTDRFPAARTGVSCGEWPGWLFLIPAEADQGDVVELGAAGVVVADGREDRLASRRTPGGAAASSRRSLSSPNCLFCLSRASITPSE